MELNQYGKLEDPMAYVVYLTSEIEDAKGKVAGWMRGNIHAYVHSHFPAMSDHKITNLLLEFSQGVKAIW